MSKSSAVVIAVSGGAGLALAKGAAVVEAVVEVGVTARIHTVVSAPALAAPD